MITPNNRSVFHCPNCGRFIGNVTAMCRGTEGDEKIQLVYGDCRAHGRVVTRTDWVREEFFPEEGD